MLESITEPASSFAMHHPGLANGLLTAGVVILAGAAIIGATRFGLRKLGVLD